MVNHWNSEFLAEKSFSLEQALRIWLSAAIPLVQADINAAGIKIDEGALPLIPLKQMERETIQFVSAIALRLETPWHEPALAIARKLAAALQKVLPEPPEERWMQLCATIEIEVQAPGWLFLRLSDESLALWLEWLTSVCWNYSAEGAAWHEKTSDSRELLASIKRNGLEVAEPIWEIQATYARCCSLLRLAEAQGIVQLVDQPTATDTLSILQPSPIPWLRCDRKLQSQTPVEHQLIAQLVHTFNLDSHPDNSISPETSRKLWSKQGCTLKQAFHQFNSTCRIFGDVQAKNLALSQARIGLVGATRICLRGLLVKRLGVVAPENL